MSIEYLDETWIQTYKNHNFSDDIKISIKDAKRTGKNKSSGLSSEQAIALWADDEYKKHQIARRAEYMQTDEYKDKISKANKGKTRTEESKESYRKAARSRPKTPCKHCGKLYAKAQLVQHEPACKKRLQENENGYNRTSKEEERKSSF